MVKRLTTMINVSDMDRSVAFYRDVVQLPLRFQSPFWSEFDAAGSLLALHGGSDSRGKSTARENVAGEAHIGFNVDDLDAEYARLKSAGVDFAMEPQPRAGEPIRLAVFIDPDSMHVSLSEQSKG